MRDTTVPTNSLAKKTCEPWLHCQKVLHRRPQPDLLRRISSNDGLSGIAPFTV
jgi:hypothetical protein